MEYISKSQRRPVVHRDLTLDNDDLDGGESTEASPSLSSVPTEITGK